MKKYAIVTALAIASVGAIAQNGNGLPPGIAKKFGHQQASSCNDCGTVQEVRHEKRKGEGGAVGIVAGAAAGGLVGNQFGKGDGKTAMTVAGAVAGGFAGNEVQKRVTAKEVWVTKVKMRDGSMRSFEHEKQPAWKVGSVLRVGANNSVALVD